VKPLRNDDGERSPAGVIVTRRDLGGGKSRVPLDDVRSPRRRSCCLGRKKWIKCSGSGFFGRAVH
jgi:hypothetical protein